jgi:hypothetical protein
MAEVNSLILNVQSNGINNAADRLNRLGQSASRAEKSYDRFGKEVKNTERRTSTANRNADKLKRSTDGVGKSADRANKSLFRFSKTTRKTGNDMTKAGKSAGGLSRGLGSIGGTLGKIAAPLLAAAGGLAALKKAVGSTRELQDWQAQLETATGSAEFAAVAFEDLERFATETPYALEQSVQAFVKETNLGLNPSEEALRSYGNTAAAMGKDLNQLIEAVADASTGEFERLKEFGIKAKTEGDKVTFTFRGVEKTIRKDSQAIQQYLKDIGDTEFAGAMQKRMDTVGGKISNLEDSWNKLWRTVSSLGVGNLIADGLDYAINFLNDFIYEIESGALQEELKGWAEGWSDFGELVTSILGTIQYAWNKTIEFFNLTGDDATLSFIDSLKLLPAIIKYWIKRAGIEFEFIVSYVTSAGIKMYNQFVLDLKAMFAIAKTVAASIGSVIADGLNPFSETTLKESLEDSLKKGFAERDKIQADYNRRSLTLEQGLERERNQIRKKAEQERYDIALEFDNKLAKVRRSEARAEKLREAGNLKKEEGLNLLKDSGLFSEKELTERRSTLEERDRRRAEYEQKQLEDAKLRKERAAERERNAQQKANAKKKTGSGSIRVSDFDRLVENLRREEDALEGSYLKRLDLIRNNTAAGSELRAELEAKINSEYEEQLQNFQERQLSEVDILRNGFDLQLDDLQSFYDRRKEIIIQNESLTQEEKRNLIEKTERERTSLMRAMEIERAQQSLQITSDYFSNFSQLSESNNKKLARLGRAALAVQKGIAMTQAIINTYEAATSAYKSTALIPVVGPALAPAAAAAAVAAGLANVAAIRSASAGNFTNGGIVGGNSYSGDRLTANVNSAEMILNTSQQRQLFDMANGRGNGGGNVTIINQTSQQVEGEARQDEQGNMEIIIREAVKRTKSDLTTEANRGGQTGGFVSTLANNYGLTRKGA